MIIGGTVKSNVRVLMKDSYNTWIIRWCFHERNNH